MIPTATCPVCGHTLSTTSAMEAAIRESRAQVIHGANGSGHYIDGPYYAPLPTH